MTRRIGIISSNYHPRTCGVGDYSMRLGAELHSRGAQVCVYSRQPAEPHPDAPDLPVRGLPGSTPSSCVRQFLRQLEPGSLDEVLLQYTPQMFGAWRFGSVAIPVLLRELRRRRIRSTVIAHELFFSWSWRPDLALASLLHRAALGTLLRHADRVVVTTETRRRLILPMAQRLGRDGRVNVVPVGSNAIPVPSEPPPGVFRVGLFSTLAFGKRFDVLLDAFERIWRAVGEAELVLVGDLGAGRRRKSLEMSVSRHPASRRIHLTGILPLQRVAQTVAGFHVFLFPMDTGATTRSSTLPLALGCGVPVVAIRGPETDDVFRGEENVVFAENLTGEAFARASLRLLGDPGLSRRVAEGGMRTYANLLAWPVIASRLVSQSP